MTDQAESPPKPAVSRMPLLIGLVLALILGAGGFFATFTGLLAGGGEAAMPQTAARNPPTPAGSFVPIDAITINLGNRGEARHLRVVAQMEVEPAHATEISRLMPRIVDVLNIYLRAIDPPEIEEPAALLRLRAQMLRRIQIVTGPGRVRDLLITEFIFN